MHHELTLNISFTPASILRASDHIAPFFTILLCGVLLIGWAIDHDISGVFELSPKEPRCFKEA
jgi:hypothetical protein